MAGAVDLLLYGIAIFISPVAVYFKKGVGVQFWVNCCLYCLMGVPGLIHAFYIIHTTKNDKKSQQQPHAAPPDQFTRQRTSSLRPSLPHLDRYRPAAPFSPYEDHPPNVPPKQEERLPYDPALHPNASNRAIGRAKSVLHTYQIPESTLHPPPLSRRARGLTPSPGRPVPEPPTPEPPTPEPQPQPQSAPETRASSSTLHPDPGSLPYPAEYHPNSTGANIGRAKAVLHTYQIPEISLPPPEDPPAPEPDQTLKRNKTTASIMKGWSLRSKGKGLSPLDVNSPTAVPKPEPADPRHKWATTGPSWLRRRRGREEQAKDVATTDGEALPTMTMVWDDNFEALRPADRNLKQARTHERSASEPVALSFPVPPGSVRPVVDRTGTSNTELLNQIKRRESGLEAVEEDTPIPESTVSEGENATAKISPTQGHADTDTEIGRSKSRLMARLGRRQPRPRLETLPDATPPTSTASAPPKTETESPQSPAISPPLSRHIAPPAMLASSIDEPRPGLFRRPRTSSRVSPPNTSPKSAAPVRNDINFAIGEFGLGGSRDAYSAGSRALHSRERSRSGSATTSRGLPSARHSGQRLSTSTALSQETPNTPLMRMDWTQGTFGTGITERSSSTNATSVEDGARPPTLRSKSQGDLPDSERSQDEEIDEWIRQEDERRESASRAATTLGHSQSSDTPPRGIGPATESIFSVESSGFAGIGVGTAVEKGQAGKLEVWDQPNWDGSNPSAHSHSTGSGYPYAQREEDPFKDPVPAQDPSTDTHSSYATGQESLPPVGAPLSPPMSPERPIRPTRAPPPVPSSSSPTSSKPAPLRMATFGTAGESSMSFGLLSPSKEPGTSSSPPVKTQAHTTSPPTSPPMPSRSSKPSSFKPPVPARPHASPPRPQSPKLPPKPAILRSMSNEDDDLSEVYARALRDEI